jgi:hypothetical protein
MITPKQKAKELFDKMYAINEDDFISEYVSKATALIAVEEILKANVVWYEGSIPYKYWIAVQKELQKLCK